jgi:hypothetical protein
MGDELQPLALLRHQRELIGARAHNIAMPAGYRAGKSRGVVLWAIRRAEENAIPGTVLAGMLVEPTYTMVNRILVRDLVEVLRELDIPYTRWTQERRFRLHFGDGREFDLYLASADRPDSLVGTTLCFVALDEAGIMRQEVFDRAMPRVSEPKAKILQFLAAGTPEGFGPFYGFAEGKAAGNVHLIRASTMDNPYLPGGPAEYVRLSLSHLSDQEKLQYVNGLFIARGGRVYDYYSAEDHERPCEDPMAGELVMGCDFGVTTACFALGTIFTDVDDRRGMRPVKRERLHIWGEVVGRRQSTLTMADITRDAWVEAYVRHEGHHIEWSALVGRIKAYCDAAPNGRADREILMDRGFDVISGSRNDTVMDRVYSLNAKLKRGELTVDPEGAPYIASCLRQQGYDRYGRPEKPFDDGSGDPGPDHGADAVGYAVAHRWPVLTPRGSPEVHHHH